MEPQEVLKPITDQKAGPVQQDARVFPTPETNLARVLTDPLYRRSFHARLKRYNPVVVILYRIGLLPLFGASRMVMLLTTRGRKSGKLRCTPIGYFRIGRGIYLFSAWGNAASWYKNMIASPEHIRIQIGLRRRSVQAQVITEPAEIQLLLAQFIQESPAQAHNLFGWDPDHDQMEHADFSLVMERVLIIRFVEQKP